MNSRAKAKVFIKRHTWILHLLVALSYLFFSFYYMGPSITHCNDTLYGFGDNTAGPIWRNTVSPSSPLWGYEKITNFPVGENLSNPVNFSAAGQYTLYWGLAKAAGPICGYNIMNIAGFVSSALVMYGFIYVLTKKRWIAILAGYAVSFSPYFQMKIGGHEGYGYQGLLIGIIWVFYNLIKKQRKRDAVYLSILLAACFYFDPYFSLLATFTIAPLVAIWAILSVWRLKRGTTRRLIVWKQLKLLSLSLFTTALLLLPLGAILVSKGSEISTSVAASRGNVLFEARACSNLPHEYVLPFVLHPVFTKLFGGQYYTNLIDQLHDGFSCGIGEDTVGISIVIVLTVMVGLVIFAWEILSRRRLKIRLSYDVSLVVLGMLALGLTAAIMALPPLKFGGIPSPSYALLELTSTWRTLTRLYVIVNLANVVLFAIFLTFFASNFAKYKKLLIFGFCLIVLSIFVEYQAFRPFVGNSLSTFSYSKDAPAVYTWLKAQNDINVIAEYPLEKSGGESNATAYYLSMQLIHEKKLFNASDPISHEEELRASLKDISDPQTTEVLYSLGIDAVVIHGVSEKDVRKIPGLEVIHVATQPTFSILAYTPLVKNDNSVVAKLLPQKKTNTMMAFKTGFQRNTNIIKSSVDWEYEATNNAIINISPIPGSKAYQQKTTKLECFDVRISDTTNETPITILADDTNALKIHGSSNYVRVRLNAIDHIKITNSEGVNMRIRNLGCSSLDQ